jgi:hypothetical protein
VSPARKPGAEYSVIVTWLVNLQRGPIVRRSTLSRMRWYRGAATAPMSTIPVAMLEYALTRIAKTRLGKTVSNVP